MADALSRWARAAPRCAAAAPQRRSSSLHRAAPRSRRQRTRAAGFNANDPATWGAKGAAELSQASDADEALQVLSDEQFATLLAQASVPSPVSAPAKAAPQRAPEDAATAIAAGLRAFAAGDAAAALALFNAALELPGSGVLRTKGKPRELSTGELQAALYNSACCHACLGDNTAGLEALRMAVGAGFDDWSALRRDADLAPLRSSPDWARFAAGFGATTQRPAGFFGSIFGGR